MLNQVVIVLTTTLIVKLVSALAELFLASLTSQKRRLSRIYTVINLSRISK